MHNFYYIFFTFLFFGPIQSQTLKINEIVSSNNTVLYDEDEDSPDWIEIYNASSEKIQLLDYGITNDFNDLNKWIFPSIEIQSNEYLLVFASSKNRKEIVSQWDAVITQGDQWQYWVGAQAPAANWKDSGSVMPSWSSGPSGFGYGDNDDNTQISQTSSVYIRKVFEIISPQEIVKILFHIDFDDGYVAYLNGKEFSRKNLGLPGSVLDYNTKATALHEAEIYNGGFPENIFVDLNEFPLSKGKNILAVEVHNYTSNSSDLTCIPFLTIGYKDPQIVNRKPDNRINLPNTFLHTNFKISTSGELIALVDSQGIVVDSVSTGQIPTDKSKGRYLEGEDWKYFNAPSPGKSNSSNGYFGFLSVPKFSIQSGFYSASQKLSVSLSSSDSISIIYFTMDGSEPTTNSSRYTQPIEISSNQVVTAKAYLDGWLPSYSESQTYIFNSQPDIPAIFVTVDPFDFFDADSGIYAKGNNASADFPHFGANFWEDWERPAHFRILEPNGTSYGANSGVKIFGGWSRGMAQKSLSFFARGRYGANAFNYKLFPNSSNNSYESFVLRNSGNDWDRSMLRDGYTVNVVKDVDIEFQNYRPSIVYINGEYWGIQNIREKVSEHFLASKSGVPTSKIDLIAYNGEFENNTEVIHGSKVDYINLLDYLNQNSLTDPVVYNAIENWIDIDDYIKYQVIQIFISNTDWPGNNQKLWRDKRVGGKWRFILYDTDFAFAFVGWLGDMFSHNTLAFALDKNGDGWPNPPWSTFLFRKLMENNSFKNRFINIYCDYLNTIFKSSNLNLELENVRSGIEKYINEHHQRWKLNPNWRAQVNKIKTFNNERPKYAKQHIKSRFQLNSPKYLKVNIEPKYMGSVTLNTVSISGANEWVGEYFPGVPISALAVPRDGYSFSHWKEFPDSSLSISIDVNNVRSLTAVFKLGKNFKNAIVINEVNYNSSNSHDTDDWIELFNSSSGTVNMENWTLRDKDTTHSFIFPSGAIIQPSSYLIIARKPDQFKEHVSTPVQILGPTGFGLSGGGDQIKIYSDLGELVDSVLYDDELPWPVEADGKGFTLELINPSLNNSISYSWVASFLKFGSPGKQNSNYKNLSIDDENSAPQKIALLPSYPNPFNGYINIPFETNIAEPVKISIINLLGQEVKFFNVGNLYPGKHVLKWNARDKNSADLSAGVYIVSLNSGPYSKAHKILYLK